MVFEIGFFKKHETTSKEAHFENYEKTMKKTIPENHRKDQFLSKEYKLAIN